MKTTLLALLLTLPFASAAERFKTLHVAELAALTDEKAPVSVYDVNTESTRAHAGLIPGARLLSSSSKYDVAAELPADKSSKLVFYCANTMCTASHQAAERAIDAGYKDVGVMVDGIYGWKKAGRTVQLFPSEVDSLVKKKAAVIVDVREAEERHEIIAGSRWFPMSKAGDSKAWSEFATQLPKDKTVIFHCAMGVRAKRAADRLASSGRKTAFFESPDQWKKAGLPVIAGPAGD